jgi:2'-5' RNA ligase
MTSYAVALTFPADIEKELNLLRDKYNKYVRYSITAHLTLKQPFKLIAGLTVVNERLKAVASRTKPFFLELDGVEYFEETNNVAYVAIKNKSPVIDLHANIVRSLQRLVEGEYEENEEYNLEKFTPHITIAELIPDAVFPVIKQEISNYRLDRNVNIGSFALFSSGEDAVWKPETIFRLSGE